MTKLEAVAQAELALTQSQAALKGFQDHLDAMIVAATEVETAMVSLLLPVVTGMFPRITRGNKGIPVREHCDPQDPEKCKIFPFGNREHQLELAFQPCFTGCAVEYAVYYPPTKYLGDGLRGPKYPHVRVVDKLLYHNGLQSCFTALIWGGNSDTFHYAALERFLKDAPALLTVAADFKAIAKRAGLENSNGNAIYRLWGRVSEKSSFWKYAAS